MSSWWAEIQKYTVLTMYRIYACSTASPWLIPLFQLLDLQHIWCKVERSYFNPLAGIVSALLPPPVTVLDPNCTLWRCTPRETVANRGKRYRQAVRDELEDGVEELQICKREREKRKTVQEGRKGHLRLWVRKEKACPNYRLMSQQQLAFSFPTACSRLTYTILTFLWQPMATKLLTEECFINILYATMA